MSVNVTAEKPVTPAELKAIHAQWRKIDAVKGLGHSRQMVRQRVCCHARARGRVNSYDNSTPRVWLPVAFVTCFVT